MSALHQLRQFAVGRSLFAEVSLDRAVSKLGFVQADPIRQPARAEDLILRQRVKGYREGDLLRRYAKLGLEEDHFVNYGFLRREDAALLHPRGKFRVLSAKGKKRASAILEHVKARGHAHPRDVDAAFDFGSITNYWGGSSSATTHLLARMHDHGLLRVVKRDGAIRIYEVREAPIEADATTRARRLLEIALRLYAPVPHATLVRLAGMVKRVVPALAKEVAAELARWKKELPRAEADGVTFYWPADEDPRATKAIADRVRFLAPFDPVVWDRARFEKLWGWEYRFEAYTPVKKRKLGYYALPLLWRDRAIGWCNTSDGLDLEFGWVKGSAPKEKAFTRELDAEVERLRAFLRAR